MKQRSSVCLMKWLALMLASLLPLSSIAAEPVKGVQIPSAIDLTLPIHQQPKLHPELFDPVLGDQAQIVEWAWSPQYAERFGLQPQPDGLPNGGLWLVGVKIERKQYRDWQRYACNIVGVMDNRLPILTPPGERYVVHPANQWIVGLPGKSPVASADLHNEVEQASLRDYTPAQVTWHKYPKNKLEQTRPKGGVTRNYLHYYRRFQNNLAYFEIEGGCSYFNNPQQFRNQIRFPSKADGGIGKAVYESSAVAFDLPDSLMNKIYPYAIDADDWSSCLLRRAGDNTDVLSLRARKLKRFGNTCEPLPKKQK